MCMNNVRFLAYVGIKPRLSEKYLILLWSHDIHVIKFKKPSSSMQVCIADLQRKGQKDGAHDNLIMTPESKFGMPAFH